MFCVIVFIELIQLNDINEFCGIAGIGGISRSLQSLCPPSVISIFQAEQALVSLSRNQKARMVLIALVCVVVSPETLVAGIVVVIYFTSLPTVALYANVIIELQRKITTSRSSIT